MGMDIIPHFCEKSVQSGGKIKTYRKLSYTVRFNTEVGLFQNVGHMLKAKADKH